MTVQIDESGINTLLQTMHRACVDRVGISTLAEDNVKVLDSMITQLQADIKTEEAAAKAEEREASTDSISKLITKISEIRDMVVAKTPKIVNANVA